MNSIKENESKDINAHLEEVSKNKGSYLVDVRTELEYTAGHIPGGINLPLDKLEGLFPEAVADKASLVYLYCRSGVRSEKAAGIIREMGYENVVNIGGINAYKGVVISGNGGAKTIIIGGSAGGATAAARLRRLDEDAQIIIIEKSAYVSQANCGLPYYLGGVIPRREALAVQTPQGLIKRYNIDVRVKEEVISIDKQSKSIKVRRLGDDSLYTENYDNLIIATGATPFIPDIEGVDLKGVFPLRNMEDTFAIDDYIREAKPQRVLVVGAGAVGLEVAENLKERGLRVDITQKSAHVMPSFDDNMAVILEKELKAKGIEVHLSKSLQAIRLEGGFLGAYLDKGEPIFCDMIIIALGVVPQSALAKEAGLLLGIKDAIVVNEYMQTSDEDIYAVGDAVQIKELVTGNDAYIALAGPANKQGRIAADNICGLKTAYKGSQATSIIKVFELSAASTGLSHGKAIEAGYDCDYVLLTLSSHASYYPGAQKMILKIVFEKQTGRLLGAQIIGGEGTDKRIDVIATAINAGMSAIDLTELDLAYAPPYSSAKDPVNMAGYALENLLKGKLKQIHWEDLPHIEGDYAILDVRTTAEYEKGHIEGALHYPLDEIRVNIDKLPQNKTLYIHCQSGLRSYIACRILAQRGFECVNIAGGYGFYAYSLD